MKPVVLWVLLVDKMHARILETQGPEAGLVQLPGRVYDAPRLLSYFDDEGGAHVRNTGANVRLDKRIGHTPESIEFGREFVGVLSKALQHAKFDLLVICAAPSMLGLMRQYLAGVLQTVVKHQLAKDLVHVPMKDMPAHFDSILRL